MFMIMNLIIIDLIKNYRNMNLHLDLVTCVHCSVTLLVDFGISFELVDGITGRGEGKYILHKQVIDRKFRCVQNEIIKKRGTSKMRGMLMR